MTNKKDYLEQARNCWNSIRNLKSLPPGTYGMKVAFERKIKELEKEIEELKKG